VVDAITASGAPVVGHNCWLDFSHSVAKFVGPPAPNVADFAAQLATLFPTVYDTKHLLGDYSGGGL
jgi:poly(A)-specific ribonuclease